MTIWHSYKHPFGIMTINKCASTSMANAMTGLHYKRCNDTNYLQGKPLHVWVRDPFERVQSCYKYFVSIPSWKAAHPSWEVFCDRVLHGEQDTHFTPQATQMPTYEGLVMHLFETLNEDWHDLFGLDLWKRRVSESTDEPLPIPEEFYRYYSADMAMREWIRNARQA